MTADLGLAFPDWTMDAVCAQTDPELFFPNKGNSPKAAKAVCATCPVRLKCLEYALSFESGEAGVPTSYAQVGIYGGLSAIERRRLLQERRTQDGAA